MLAGILGGGRLIQFFTGPAGKVILLALAFSAWTLYQRMDATRDCEAAELREELIESQRQLEIARGISQDARVRADQAETEMADTERQYDDLKQSLADNPDSTCPIDADTRERLLRIK